MGSTKSAGLLDGILRNRDKSQFLPSHPVTESFQEFLPLTAINESKRPQRERCEFVEEVSPYGSSTLTVSCCPRYLALSVFINFKY